MQIYTMAQANMSLDYMVIPDYNSTIFNSYLPGINGSKITLRCIHHRLIIATSLYDNDGNLKIELFRVDDDCPPRVVDLLKILLARTHVSDFPACKTNSWRLLLFLSFCCCVDTVEQ